LKQKVWSGNKKSNIYYMHTTLKYQREERDVGYRKEEEEEEREDEDLA
jgi:hypothetical protein